jgi:hypothetical protein
MNFFRASTAPLVAAVGIAAFSVVAAGCGGSGSSSAGVANLGETTTTQTTGGSPQGSLQATALRYSRCIRSHGVPDFPDPSPRGGINLTDQPGSDVNPSNPALQGAMLACAKIGVFAKGNPTPARQRQYTDELLRFARCVRAHGVPNFPDPSSLGPAQGIGFLIDRNTLDPHSPALQAAVTACQRVVPVNPAFKSYSRS